MTKFLTIVVVLRRVEDLLEYNVDPISDSENLDLAPKGKRRETRTTGRRQDGSRIETTRSRRGAGHLPLAQDSS